MKTADSQRVASLPPGWLHTLLSTLPDAVVAVDADKRIRFMSPVAEARTGYRLSDAQGKLLSEVLAVVDGRGKEITHSVIEEALETSMPFHHDRNVLFRPRHGPAVPADLTLAVVRNDRGLLCGTLLVFRDAGERRRMQDALRDSQDRYELAARAASDGLWDWSLKANKIYYSTPWKTMLGWGEHDIGESPAEWLGRIHQEDVARVRAAITSCLNGEATSYETEYRMQHRGGEHRWMRSRGISVKTASGQVARLVGWQTDITEQLLTESKLRHDALHDALTGLPNRTFFTGLLDKCFARAQRRTDLIYAILVVDVDRFNVIIDSLGPRVGDRLLIEIARRLEATLRPGDTVTRLGGDEYGILVEDIRDEDDATRVAHRVHQALAPPFDVDGKEVFLTASIGIALSSTPYESPDQLLRDADTAMYRAKANGRARYEVFDTSMHARAVARLELETDLRHALERHEIELHYQPIVALADGRITGFEALARWQHPRRGSVPPAEFIPLAEETGVIVPLGGWLLHEACRQTREWQDERGSADPLTISVNLSCKQFTQPMLVRQIEGILEDTGLDPRSLKLEITESSLMEDPAAASEILSGLKALELDLHMDDFGTGYSSLSYLHKFHVDALKVDQSFVHNLEASDQDREIVRTIMSLARNLGMDVIAEGVESRAQLSHLRNLDCRLGQGYYFSAPLRGAEARQLVAPGPQWSLLPRA